MTNWATCYFLLNFLLVSVLKSIRSFNQGVTDYVFMSLYDFFHFIMGNYHWPLVTNTWQKWQDSNYKTYSQNDKRIYISSFPLALQFSSILLFSSIFMWSRRKLHAHTEPQFVCSAKIQKQKICCSDMWTFPHITEPSSITQWMVQWPSCAIVKAENKQLVNT